MSCIIQIKVKMKTYDIQSCTCKRSRSISLDIATGDLTTQNTFILESLAAFTLQAKTVNFSHIPIPMFRQTQQKTLTAMYSTCTCTVVGSTHFCFYENPFEAKPRNWIHFSISFFQYL